MTITKFDAAGYSPMRIMLGVASIIAAVSITPAISSAKSTIDASAIRQVSATARHTETKPDHKGTSAVAASYAKIPLSFEPNHGQTDPSVKYLSRGRGYSLFLTPGEAVLSLKKPEKHANHGAVAATDGKQPHVVLRVSLAGANHNARIEGVDRLAGKSNYLIGKDPKKWHTNVPTFAQVKYDGVYPGIDLVYHGSSQRQLEYDFHVAPGANPKQIKMGFSGARKLTLDSHGDLVVHMADGDVIEHAPVVYQEINGGRRMVKGHYAMRKGNSVGFIVAAYDRSKPLIIDPVLAYSTFLGGDDFDSGNAIAVNSAGNAFVAGETDSDNFPTTPGAFDTTQPDFRSAFVTELNPSGSALVYSTYLGGSGGDDTIAYGIAIDSSGHAFVTGATCDDDFPTTVGAFQTSLNGCDNAFVTELTPDGSSLVYSTYLGGGFFDDGYAIAVSSSGNAFVTGDTCSEDFPTTAGAFQTTLNGCTNAFVTEFTVDGSNLVYSTYLGGGGSEEFSDGDFGNSIAVDFSGDAYVTGGTFSVDFPVTPGAFQTTNNGGIANAFVTKMNPLGTGLVFSTYLGGDFYDQGIGIAIDPTGDAYVAGITEDDDFPTTPGAFQTSFQGFCEDGFMTELNPAGSALAYSSYFAGDDGCDQLATGISLDPAGDVFIAGTTDDPDEFPITVNASCAGAGNPFLCCTGAGTGVCSTVQATYGGNGDAFLAEFESHPSFSPPLGVALSTYAGATDSDEAFAVAYGPAGSVYMTGITGCGELDEAQSGVSGKGAGTTKPPQPTRCEVKPLPVPVPVPTSGGAAGDFPTTPGAFQTVYGGGQDDAFVQKIGCLPVANATIFVGNSYDPVNNSTVTTYPFAVSNCDSPPAFPPLFGPDTGLNFPFGLAYSTTNQNLYVVNYGGASVSVYSMAEWQAGGDQIPIATISGPNTGLNEALGIAVDSAGDVYVANSRGGNDYFGSVTIYSAAQVTAGGGNIPPVATIIGTVTKLFSPQGIAIDPNNNRILVANLEGPNGTGGDGSVTIYPSLANLPSAPGYPNVMPIGAIGGSLTQLSQPAAIAVDSANPANIYVANNSGDSIGPSASGKITIYTQPLKSPTSNPANVPPAATIVGPDTLLNNIEGIAVDINGLIYTANFGYTGSVTIYPPLGNLSTAAGYPDVAPIADITGPDTGLFGPRGIAVDPPAGRTRRQRQRRRAKR
ncbi:MAG TPA: SBBP repeat-containing protein [Candidatus Binataceae bacterium]|nr:SBBP repeat-containing protein [Candidatus Binataceae bacterium]